jgi:hypothetical protein
MVQVHHDEGVANRIDPESCADAREGIGETLTGERIGQPLSRESTLILGADVVLLTEGNTDALHSGMLACDLKRCTLALRRGFLIDSIP